MCIVSFCYCPYPFHCFRNLDWPKGRCTAERLFIAGAFFVSLSSLSAGNNLLSEYKQNQQVSLDCHDGDTSPIQLQNEIQPALLRCPIVSRILCQGDIYIISKESHCFAVMDNPVLFVRAEFSIQRYYFHKHCILKKFSPLIRMSFILSQTSLDNLTIWCYYARLFRHPHIGQEEISRYYLGIRKSCLPCLFFSLR